MKKLNIVLIGALIIFGITYCSLAAPDRNNSADPNASNFRGGGSASDGSGGSGGSGSGTFNLEVPIEMVDYGLQGNAATQNFTQTQTALDTSEYDGTISYVFEIVGQNTSGGNHTLQLLDGALNVCGSVSIASGTITPTRLRTNFTPVAPSSVYTVNISSAAPSTVRVFAARMIVQQTNATKTRIYLPLINANQGVTQTNTLGSVTTVGAPGFGRDTAHDTAWLYQSSRYPNLATANPFTLDVVMAASGGATIQHFLEDMALTQVATSLVSTTLAAPTRLSASFSSSALNSGSTYRVAYNGPAGGPYENRRVLIDLSKFSNPLTYFEITGNGGSNSVSLSDIGTTDNGTGGASAVASSSVNTGAIHAPIRTPALTLTSGNRYIGSGVASSPTQFVVVVARTP